MKRRSLCLWLALSLAPPAWGHPLSFQARIQDERLAEAAVDLLRCVSERLGHGWQLALANEIPPPPSLFLTESQGKLRGTFRTEGDEVPLSLTANTWPEACDQALAPPSSPLAPVPPAAPPLPNPPPAPPSRASLSPWLWASAAAVLAGGLIFWRSRRADHRSLRME